LDLIKVLAEQQGLTKPEATRSVEIFFDAMARALEKGERVEIRGLCAFKVKTYKSYAGRNPKTGEQETEQGHILSAAGQGRSNPAGETPARKAGRPPGSESLEAPW
jgi:integration host factor subunit beta